MSNGLKASTLMYFVIGSVAMFGVAAVATVYYGSGGLYVLLIVLTGLSSVFFVSVLSGGIQTSVTEGFGEKTIDEVVTDVGFDVEYSLKRFRDKIFFKD